MLKKAMLAVVALMFTVALAAPTPANAQVIFRVGVGPVVFAPAPVVVVPQPAVAVPDQADPAATEPAPAAVPAPVVVYAYSPYVYPSVAVGFYPRGYVYRGFVPRFGWRR